MDVFKIKGIGINRLSLKLAELIPYTRNNNHIQNEPTVLDEILLETYRKLTTYKRNVLVRMDYGPYPDTDDDTEVSNPGLVIYVPKLIQEYAGITEAQCISAVRDMLRSVIAKTEHPLLNEIKEHMTEIEAIPAKEIDAEGCFY